MDDVVPGYEQHQHQHERKADPETDFLSARAQRPAAKSLIEIEQQVAATGAGPVDGDAPAGRAFGLLVLGSPDPTRYSADMGTDFLVRIGEVAGAALSRLVD